MAEAKGIAYLRRKLELKRTRVLTRYKFYEMKHQVPDFGISTPPNLRLMQTSLGWCGKAVDALADRLVFREFADDNFNLNEIYRMNNPDVLYDAAILAALIGSCSFLYISPDESGYPRLQVLDGSDATGIVDPITNLLLEGYAVLKRDNRKQAILEAHFLPGETIYYERGKGEVRRDENPAPYPLLVPVIYRPDAKRPFGHSRISRACMDIVRCAQRGVKRAEISAEFYSFPQRYVLGTSPDLELDKWSAAMSALINISKDDDGDKPAMGQFQQQSMSPHTEQIRMFAAMFAGETGLTLDDLGFVTDNPSSAEAIKASHENLRLTARKAQRTFGSCFLNAGYLAACVRDNYAYQRRQFYLTAPKWEPVFEPDAGALSVIGDGAIKVNQAVPGYFNADNLHDLTGIASTPAEV